MSTDLALPPRFLWPVAACSGTRWRGSRGEMVIALASDFTRKPKVVGSSPVEIAFEGQVLLSSTVGFRPFSAKWLSHWPQIAKGCGFESRHGRFCEVHPSSIHLFAAGRNPQVRLGALGLFPVVVCFFSRKEDTRCQD